MMKLVFIFNDGLTYTQDHDAPLSLAGEGDFIDRLHQGKVNNAQITFTDKNGTTIQRRYNDLHSVNIVMSE